MMHEWSVCVKTMLALNAASVGFREDELLLLLLVSCTKYVFWRLATQESGSCRFQVDA